MKTPEEIKAFYEQALVPDLAILERRRLGLLGRMGWAVLGGIGLLGATVVWVGPQDPTPIFFFIPVLLFFVGLAAVILGWRYKRDFKERIIRRLVSFLEPGLQYEPRGKIALEAFLRSELFLTHPNVYKGDDRIWGTVGRTSVEFSEIWAQQVRRRGKTTTVQTIFRGLFFIADFNKHFRTKTFVLPDTAEKWLGQFGKTLQSLNVTRPDLMTLDDPEFEKEFVVYGQDPIETRYILAPSLMDRILLFRRKTGRRIFLSFVGSYLYAAIWMDRPLWEPKLFRSLLDFQVILEYAEDIQLALGLVENLNLNTRIWSKE